MRTGTRRETLNAERIRLLYRNARFSIVGVLIAAALFTLFFWRTLPQAVWGGWLCVILFINVPRLFWVEHFNRRYRSEGVPDGDSALWERRFYLGVLLSSLSWASVSLFPFQGDIRLSLAYTALLLIAMSSASIVMLITSLKMGVTFITLVILPLIGRILWEGGQGATVLATACVVYYFIFLLMARRLHFSIVDNIRLKLENEELSLKDSLTGLWNRRELYLFVDQLRSQAQRSGESFALILMDLDHFKRYNDSNGHTAGDTLLMQVARIIQRESREEDLAVRYGGEEFMVVLPKSDLEQARHVAERIRQEVRRLTAVSLSAGIATFQPGMSFERLTSEADQALYRAKSGGRDRVVVGLVTAAANA
ncbi:MAG: diguanylate cyclase [Pseudomonadota bacterium]